MRSRRVPIRAPIKNNRVLTRVIDLDDGVASWGACDRDCIDVHALRFQRIAQESPVFTDPSGMTNLSAGATERDTLIEAFAARSSLVALAREGFAGANQGADPVNVVDVERTKIENLNPSHALVSRGWMRYATRTSRLALPDGRFARRALG